MPVKLTNQQIEKIGNAMIYLSEKVSELNKTKILKLLFFLEELSIKKYGYPFFGVDFKLWVRGPVLENVFFDFDQDSLVTFGEYLKRAEFDKELYVANKVFDDDEFSDNDIKLLDEICKLAKHKNASDLVRLSHEKGSLWEKSAKWYGVFNDLILEKVYTTDYKIDFSLLLEGNDFLKERYENAIENLNVINSLKP
jgi:uncharacterized phage-associated protein